jgi:SAM-dependent methyltransferase
MDDEVPPQPYDTYAAGYAQRLDPTLADAVERLAELAGARPGLRLLDVATGTGAALRAAAERGATVIGVDCSPGMLAIAKELSRELDLRHADAHALPFNDADFDAVTCGLSLSHFADSDRALGEIVRVLRPGGRFVASAWGDGSHLPTGVVDKLLNRYGAPIEMDELDEETWQSPEQGSAALRRAGFADVSVRSEAFSGSFAHPEDALDWALGWPLTASRVARLRPECRDRFRRESLEALASSHLSWLSVFNFYSAST